MSDERLRGILKTYNVVKGFGFISREKGKDIFVLFNDFISADADASALIGSDVEFELVSPAPLKGPRAKNVRVVG
jgi:CspA family cold shock protein